MKKIENSECQVEFGEFLKRGRTQRDMLQTEVAALAGITQAFYSQIENGIRNIDFVLALRLCQIIRIDINDFIKQYMRNKTDI